jgi:16S rRNA (cytosine967-C5)-methyltransferase
MTDDAPAAATARDVARRVLDRVAKERAWATLALDGELQRTALEDRDRRLAAELVYGVLRAQSRLDRALAAHADLARTPPKVQTILRVGAYQLLFLDRVPPYAVVDDAASAARAFGGPKLAGFANAVLRKVHAVREPALPDDPLERLAALHSLPRWILDELVAAVEPETDVATIAAAFGEQAPLVARANRMRTTPVALAEHLGAAGATVTIAGPDALVVEGLGDPGRSPSFIAGSWTVQDAGAQQVGHVAAPLPGQRILDACAGVGGKATHLAELTGDAATIDAVDRSATKLRLLAESQARLGLRSITPRQSDLLALPVAAPYDLIVLDAPCTGLGVLRRHPDAKWRLTPAEVPRLAAVQARLLDAAIPHLAPGGVLVYSVCTFTRAEGPDQIAALLARHPQLVLDRELRTWPPAADAFYIARLIQRCA